MKLDLKWIITIAVTAIIAIAGGATVIIAVPWKLDGRYKQNEMADKEHAAIIERSTIQYATMLERIGGMDITYIQSRIDDLRWKLMTLENIKRTRKLTPPEKEMYNDLKREIKRLKNELSRMR